MFRKKPTVQKPTETMHTFALAFAVDTKNEGSICGITPEEISETVRLFMKNADERGEWTHIENVVQMLEDGELDARHLFIFAMFHLADTRKAIRAEAAMKEALRKAMGGLGGL